ncbi:hypothetical protein ACFQ0G_01140 [Streptomyces chiangmaiensis]
MGLGESIRSVVNSVKSVLGIAATAPDVKNGELKKILGEIYIKPGSKPAVGNGKVTEALKYELKTGQKVKQKWHVGDAADQLRRLQKLLEADRQKNILSPRDRTIALNEAEGIWNAFDTPDKTGTVKALLKGNKSLDNAVKQAINRTANSMSMQSFTGGEFYEDPRGFDRPKSTNKVKLPRIMSVAGAGAFVIGQAPSYVRQYGFARGAWEMFKDSIDPFGASDYEPDPFYPDGQGGGSGVCDPTTNSCA